MFGLFGALFDVITDTFQLFVDTSFYGTITIGSIIFYFFVIFLCVSLLKRLVL